MKRSEAIEKIRNRLDSGYESEARAILDLIEEEIGMLPPESGVEYEREPFGDAEAYPIVLHEWEPEDEKK